MRTFIALEFPSEVKDSLERLQGQLKEAAADVKWVEPRNIHLTLKFLGERDEKKIKEIAQALEESAGNKKSFTVSLSCLGAFPEINYPRVIWVGVEKGGAEICAIAEELEEKISRLGIPKEKRQFSAHATIGRTRSAKNRAQLTRKLARLSGEAFKEQIEFFAERITLFKSTLGPKGALYEPLKEIILKAI